MKTPILRIAAVGLGAIILLVACRRPTVNCTMMEFEPVKTISIQDPPPGEPPELIYQAGEYPSCFPDSPDLRVGHWCQSQEKDFGGATLTMVSNNFSSLDRITSVIGIEVTCDESEIPPVACWGPEGTEIEVTACTQCQAENEILRDPSCAPGYYRDRGMCNYDGVPDMVSGCLPGWYMNPDGFCIQVIPATDECPADHVYEPDRDCCVQYYRNPPVRRFPPNSYSACPSSMDFDVARDKCIEIIEIMEADCDTFMENLGTCDGGREDGPCQPPVGGCSAGSSWDQDLCCCRISIGGACAP